MKKITFALVLFTLLFNLIKSNSQDYFFYHFRDIKTLHRIDGYITVKFKDNVSESSRSAINRIFTGYTQDKMTFKTGREISGSSEVLIYKLKNNLSKNISDNLIRSAASSPDVESVGYGYKANDKVVHFTTNEVIVKFRSYIGQTELNNINSLYKTRIIEKVSLFDNTYLVAIESNGIDGKDNVFDAANKYALLQNVEFAQPNFIRSGMLLDAGNPHKKHDFPTDPLLPQMWNLNNTGQALPNGVHGTPGSDMNVFPAWEVTTGSPNVMISIVDTGVDTNHYDLRGNLTDRSLWYDAYDNDQKPYDEYYHGTGVSGTSSAIANDSGTVGVAYTSKLLPVRVFGPWPTALTTDLILGKGLNWAWKHGASVINCSWGGGIPTPLISYSIQNAAKYGRNNRGTIVCAGSGNDDIEQVLYPSSMDEVFSCGGLSPCNERKHKHSCDFNGIDSNAYWGASYGTGLDFAVPCTYIGTTQLMGSWCICGNGTSVSAPLAAGVVALVLSKNINLSFDSVHIVMKRSCRKVGNYNYNIPTEYGLWNNEMGYGRLDARNALDMTPSGPGVVGDKVPPIIKIFPPESRIFSSNISFNAEIYDNISIGKGNNSPRLYFRTKQHFGIQSTSGKSIGNNLYNFNFPVIPVSEGFYYYIAAQDEAIDPNVSTYPLGGKGINPPGSTASGKFMYVRNTSLFDTAFSSADVPKFISSNTETTFVSVLNLLPAGRIICDVNCTVNITHSYDADLTLVLISPAGTKVIILGGVGWEGDGFDNTTLDDEAAISIDSSAAIAPYTGSYKPIENLWLFDGEYSYGEWQLMLVDNGHGDGGSLNSWSLEFKFAESEEIALPGKFALVRNYPNPFNPKTRIVFNVPYTSKVKLTIYDITGREVATLLNETRTARLEDFIDFDSSDPAFNNGRGLASGVYFVSMIADDNFIDTKKLVLVK